MTKSKSPTPELLAQRFAGRLNSVLDKQGFPAMPLDRARALSNAIELEVSLTSTLLNGLLLPDWDVLLKICVFTKCQPGYFLDETTTNYPTETRVVKPLGSGDNIVLRMPPKKGQRWAPPTADWSYLTAKNDMGFGVAKGDYVINYALDHHTDEVNLNSLYLLGLDNRFEIHQCIDLSNGRAVFENRRDHGSPVSRIIPLQRGQQLDEIAVAKSGVHHFGEIASMVRPPDVMLAC